MNFSPVFCTVFDKNYLYQGVTVFRSLQKILPAFKLYCLALDEESVNALRKLQEPNLIAVPLSDLPQAQVQEIRALTSYGQFCWSMQPLICRYVLDQGEPEVTYIEADAYFFSSPQPLFDELRNFSASVAPHWFAPENAFLEQIAGRYCTHFNYFKNNEDGRKILEHWRLQNFQYRKDKPLFYPGQMGLNEWTTTFTQAHELTHRGAGVAPWNVSQYQILVREDNVPSVDGVPVIFYHFHQLVRYANGSFELGIYPLSNTVIDTFYKPYVRALLKTEAEVNAKVPSFHFKREIPLPPPLLSAVLSGKISEIKKATQFFRRRLKGTYNVYDPSFFQGAL